jgi:hypothetical protein
MGPALDGWQSPTRRDGDRPDSRPPLFKAGQIILQ